MTLNFYLSCQIFQIKITNGVLQSQGSIQPNGKSNPDSNN